MTRLDDGRYIGSDGYEYFWVGSGGGISIDDLDDAQELGDRCPQYLGYDKDHIIVGKAEVCSIWENNYTKLGVKVKLISPTNTGNDKYYAYSCDVVPGSFPVQFNECRANWTDPEQFSTVEYFDNVNTSSHTGGFEFFRRGNRVIP